MQQTEFARRLPGSGSLRDTPPPTSSLPGTRRGGGEGCQRLQHLPRRLAARGAYFPSRYSEQVSLSLGKARRRQPICRQRRALPERCRAAGAGGQGRMPGHGGSARASTEQGGVMERGNSPQKRHLPADAGDGCCLVQRPWGYS